MTYINMLKYLLIGVLCFTAACTNVNKWGSVKTPTQNAPEAYGTYTAGCMDGAVALPEKGIGYEVVNGARNRFYGQPSLIGFLQEYAAKNYEQNKSTLYISDIAQPRGGPILHGHGSHQTGLDVDIWYGRKNELPIDLVNLEKKSLDEAAWNNFDSHILENAASFPEVERIFVNPYIKAKLCEEHKGEAWLSKIRPWWLHHDHFHVRMSCPVGDKFCTGQNAVDKTDGCDSTLDWWFSDEAAQQAAVDMKAKKPKVIKLPEQCDGVLEFRK
jgi:penicillin-insensitive murein endopeptidase